VPRVKTEYLGILTFNGLEEFVNTNEEVLIQIKKETIIR